MSTSYDYRLPPKLQLLRERRLPNGIHLIAAGGSILDFEGGCMVNAANTGGVTGFGLDELVNRKAGSAMKDARKKFNGIPTGTAKSTPSFNHTAVKWVIHATGPVFRENALSKETLPEKYDLLRSAYQNSLVEASRLGCKDIGLCLLSCGVFRGSEPLNRLVSIAVEAVQNHAPGDITSSGGCIQRVVIIAYTQEEQKALKEVFDVSVNSSHH